MIDTTNQKIELAKRRPMSIVFRFHAVSISRDAFEAVVSRSVDRFEPSKSSVLNYAQIDVPDDSDAWANAASMAESLGPVIAPLLERGEIGQPCADIAMLLLEGRVATSLLIPNTVAFALSRWGFHIEFSVYLASAD
jgi:hypothetical protein